MQLGPSWAVKAKIRCLWYWSAEVAKVLTLFTVIEVQILVGWVGEPVEGSLPVQPLDLGQPPDA